MNSRRISILGSTGSVGVSTLDLIEQDDNARYSIVALTANQNAERLATQALKYKPEFVALADESQAEDLEKALHGSGITTGYGEEGVLHAASLNADWTMAAIVGFAGLKPTLKAIEQGHAVALANKEALICAGPLFMQAAKDSGATILPVDSEHNAIFQCFNWEHRDQIRRIILTASGGPFRQTAMSELACVTPAMALDHPTWSMGAKISIDSATMMNKGLEIIEACHLFNLDESQVDVLVHPGSIVHGLVEYADGGLLAQMGCPDMKTPIAHALAWPDRMSTQVERLDLASLGQLIFENPDHDRFPAINLARQAIRYGGLAPAIMNAANEVAVDAFLNNVIGFTDIVEVCSQVLKALSESDFETRTLSSFKELSLADHKARAMTEAILREMNTGLEAEGSMSC